MRKFLLSLSAGSALLLANTSVALAAPSADLRVDITGPSSVAISTPTTYTISVKNHGPSTAEGVKITVAFPLTNTSPTVHILGTVSGLVPGCSIVSNTLSCNVGQLKKNKTAAFTYSYTAPVSTKVLQMTAVASSTVADPAPANNTKSLVPNLTYPTRPITSAAVTNSHCTGQTLTSYFECLLYPSSISSHNTTLNADLSVTFTEPGYTGTWSQNAAKTTLKFEYFEATGSGSTKVLEFNGFAINGANCFDGLSTFFPASPYVSPYRVCL
jgi:Domain of unknown function DUF11